ncbi:MAG: hypothetical protein M1838_005565 [Thelocarpon superellum]|nr:MAG: hypothetical protein M1838_005565 [Thelocarpon superellum]
MGGNDYTAAAGGALKLKGVSNGKVDKHKKRKKRKEGESQDGARSAPSVSRAPTAIDEESAVAREQDGEGNDDDRQPRVRQQSLPAAGEADPDDAAQDRKTAAEKRYEEQRRKRLLDRIQREGLKSHKERVEDLNKYLANLSEHHDMPRIGPG